MSTSDAIALARLASALMRRPTAEERAIQAGIDATMREVIRHDAKHNPNAHALPERPGQPGTGWVDALPLGPVMSESDRRWQEQMLDRVLPHGPESPLRKKAEGAE